jgi:tRNA-dihydrouridine synthase
MNFPLTLAPMVGLSHIALRLLVRRYLPAGAVTLWPTEMLSSWRLPKEDLGATPETLLADEWPLVPQILGNEEEPIRESVTKLAAWGAEGIDINMGCPVKKALKHNYGVALMGDAAYAAEVVRVTVRHSPVPVSVKLRAGLQNDRKFLLDFCSGLEQAGAAWITLHPRLGAMKRRGAADWSQIALVRENLRIPVVGNGDVQCVDDVIQMLETTGCDAVMAGRALAARPWMMWQLGERWGWPPPKFISEGETGSGDPIRRAPQTAEEEGAEFGRALFFLTDTLETYFDFENGIRRLKFHLRMTSGWLEFGHFLGAQISRAKSYDDVRATLSEFFSRPQSMVLRTHLRE